MLGKNTLAVKYGCWMLSDIGVQSQIVQYWTYSVNFSPRPPGVWQMFHQSIRHHMSSVIFEPQNWTVWTCHLNCHPDNHKNSCSKVTLFQVLSWKHSISFSQMEVLHLVASTWFWQQISFVTDCAFLGLGALDPGGCKQGGASCYWD